MGSPLKSWETGLSTNFHSAPVSNEPSVFGGHTSMVTPSGTVRTNQPPPLPPRIQTGLQNTSSMFGNYGSGYGHGMMGGYGLSGYGLGGYGGGYGGYGGYGSYGGYGGFSRYGGGFGSPNPLDPETQFIQYAEESSRPAFESIESLVHAIGHFAAMLDSTFFAITSSFRAVLGVAANFGRIRGVIGQFLATFSLIKWIMWLYRKVMWTLGLSNTDPNLSMFKEAFDAAQGLDGVSQDGGRAAAPRRNSPWPIISFIGFIIAAPYLIMKLIGTVSTSALEQSKDPKTWVNPIKAKAQYNFRASNSYELNLMSDQDLTVAPREIQVTQKLMNTGWALASIDGINSGLVPISYLRTSTVPRGEDHPIRIPEFDKSTLPQSFPAMPPLPTDLNARKERLETIEELPMANKMQDENEAKAYAEMEAN